MRRRWLMRALAVVLLALIAWGIYAMLAALFAEHPVTWADLGRWKPALLPLTASFALLITVYVMHALLWRRIMRDLDIATPSVGTTLRVYFIASLARYIPFAKGFGQLAGLAVLSKRAGLPPGSAAAAAVLGQFGFLTTGLLFLGISMPEWRQALDTGTDVPATLPLAVGTALLVVGAAVLWVLVATPVGHGFRTAVIRRLGARAGEKLTAAFALADRVRPASAALWAAAYALSWVLLGTAFVLFAAAFFAPAWGSFRLVAGTVAAAYLLGYLIFFLPAGLGAREAVMIALLQPLMPLAVAIVIAVASRVWFTVAELVPLAALPLFKSRPALEREVG